MPAKGLEVTSGDARRWLLFSAWDVSPTAGQAVSRSVPQTPGAQRSHSRPRQLLLRRGQTRLRKCLTPSDLTLSPSPVAPAAPAQPHAGSAPRGVRRPGFAAVDFTFVTTVLSAAGAEQPGPARPRDAGGGSRLRRKRRQDLMLS